MNEPSGDRWKPREVFNTEYNIKAHDFKYTGLAGGFMIDTKKEQSDLKYLVKISRCTNELASRNPMDMDTIMRALESNKKYRKIDKEFKELDCEPVKDFDRITEKVDKLLENYD